MFDSENKIVPAEEFRFVLEQECKRAERYECMFTVFRLSFEAISLEAGTLSRIAGQIQKVTRDSDLIGITQSGDLALLLPYADNQCAAHIASRIHDKVTTPLKHVLNLKAIRIEWACFPTHASTAEDLLGAVQCR